MSVLWETMSGLAPLIYTLPPSHVDEYEEDVPENNESTTIIGVNRHRLDSNARLALNTRRLDHYARFIKHVTIHNEDAYYATLHDLSIHKVSGYHLLPEVRTLDLHLDAVGGPEGIYMLLGPRVDAVSMFAICRNLQTLHVDFGDCHEDGSELIARLLRLISGTIRDFSSTLLINYVSVQSFSLFRNLQNLPQAFSFPTLRSLEIITDHISKNTTLFIHRIRAEHLHTLAIFLMTSLVDGEACRARYLNESLSTCAFWQTLSVVAIHPRHFANDGWRPPYSIMSPLLALPKLAALYLPRQWVADGVLETITETRPEIQLLEHCPLHPRIFPDIPDVPVSH
ncbi:hypothetical protein IEO21_10071 [Rhodonia placenta]|uniref:Uncharacterized protein n=1 Tax=Rhodonia placenta TaxID=104341 RepID=A0A8H7NT86_9APHY|nr:hypothetical protein IEO21_10071 [Postia placenta]